MLIKEIIPFLVKGVGINYLLNVLKKKKHMCTRGKNSLFGDYFPIVTLVTSPKVHGLMHLISPFTLMRALRALILPAEKPAEKPKSTGEGETRDIFLV